METVKKHIRETRRQFLVILREVVKMMRAEEGVEHQLFTLNENYTAMDKRLTGLEEYIHNMAEHLNGAIERINAIHMYLKEEEFDFDDMDPVFEKNNEQ